MRVLHVQKATGLAGSERHLLALLPALVERGLDVRMLVLAAEHADRFVAPLRAAGVATDVLPAGRHLNPSLIASLTRAIRRFNADVTHTHLIHGDLYGQLAARVARVPGVSTLHGTHDFYERQPYKTAARIAGRSATRFIAVSEHVARFAVEQRIARVSDIRVVRHGIKVDDWQLSADRIEAARRSLGLAPGQVAVGVASRLFPRKGHDVLLAAFERALPDAPQLRLLIAGDGPLRAELEARATEMRDLGQVRFLGHVADMRSFVNACDLLVFPTLPGFGEGFGLAALEAMAGGRAVIASRLDSLPELVVDGQAGVLVTPGDADELAAALIKLAEDGALRRTLGRGGQERADQEFSFERMVTKTMEIYEEVAR